MTANLRRPDRGPMAKKTATAITCLLSCPRAGFGAACWGADE